VTAIPWWRLELPAAPELEESLTLVYLACADEEAGA